MHDFLKLTICNVSHLIMMLWFVPLLWLPLMFRFYHHWRPKATKEEVDASVPSAFMITIPRWLLTLFAWVIILCIVGLVLSIFGAKHG